MRPRFLLLITGLFLTGLLPALAGDTAEADHPTLTIDGDAWIAFDGSSRNVVDPTAFCVGCHREQDPTTASSGALADDGAHSHPVGQPYPNEDPGYTPLSDLDPRLPLIDGAMACITCHDAAAPDREFTIPDASGQLCVACHKQ